MWIQLTAATILHLVLAAHIFLKTRSMQPGRMLAWMLLCIAGWTGSVAIITGPGNGHDIVLFFVRATFFCATGIGVTWLWFCVDFPYKSHTFPRVARLLTIIGCSWLVLAWTPLVIADVNKEPWPHHVGLGVIFPLFGVWVVTCALAGVLLLLHKLKQARGVERLQLRYILFGAGGMMIGGIIFNLLLPALMHSTVYAPYGPLSSVLFSIATTLAILRYRLMEIRVVIRQGLIFSLTLGILSALIIIAVFTLTLVFKKYFQFSPQSGEYIICLLIATFFSPLRNFVQAIIERKFFKSVYDYRLILRETSQAFASIRETKALVGMLTQALARTLCPSGIAIFLPNQDGALARVETTGVWDLLPGLIPDPHPLLTMSQRHDDLYITDNLLDDTEEWQEVGLHMKQWGAHVALPLIVGHQLCGMVFLGEKRSGDIYTAEDAGLLRILCKQAATALDNAHHYEALLKVNTELEQRVRQRTSQLAEANIALEAERAYLSAAIDILPIPILFRTKTATLRCNRALLDLFAQHHIADHTCVQLYNPETHMALPKEQWPGYQALTGQVITACEKVLAFPDGTMIPVLAHAGPITVGDEIVASVVAFQDISALKAADRAKNEFLAVLSHELKTPLTCILAWVEVARFDSDPSIISKALGIIRQNSLRQRHLLNDLLDVSRMIHNKLSMHPERADLWRLALESAGDLEYLCLDSKVALVLDEPDEPLPIIADPARITQVICNLITNAFKFTDPGGRITITAWREGAQAMLRVADTGRGIPTDLLSEIFLPFRQVERIEPSGGLGLGLALVKGIVELHYGTVKVESAGVGQGSAFTIALSLAALGGGLPQESERKTERGMPLSAL